MDTARGVAEAAIAVTGWSSAELDSLEAVMPRSDSAWQQIVRVTVGANNPIAVAGRYSVNDSAVVFQPLFPFDAGRSYLVRIDSDGLPLVRAAQTLAVSLPAGNQIPHTAVSRILPGRDTLPENLLRFYIEFTAPMSRTGGLEHMKLLDESGHEVLHAFLPLDADFWNEDRTRYTAFLDPGRVKRGILPNEKMGRAILDGRHYTIVIDSAWQDASGLPLTSAFRRTFRVGPPDESRIDPGSWKLAPPPSGQREPLVVTFPKPLDFGLLKRAVGVQTVHGQPITGTVRIERTETEWRFTPDHPWKSGDYQLVVFSSLEDAAGNRIDRPFEVDMFDRVDKNDTPQRFLVPFAVRSP
jgi:hypothetical protein